jgi:hypothetical protein
MTPEKHPLPKLDPIVTIPEGGDTVDEHAESPRKHRKKKRKKHHRRHKHRENIDDADQTGAEDDGVLTSPEHQNPDESNSNPEENKAKVTKDEPMNRHTPSDEGFSERKEPTCPEWDEDDWNHNKSSDV